MGVAGGNKMQRDLNSLRIQAGSNNNVRKYKHVAEIVAVYDGQFFKENPDLEDWPNELYRFVKKQEISAATSFRYVKIKVQGLDHELIGILDGPSGSGDATMGNATSLVGRLVEIEYGPTSGWSHRSIKLLPRQNILGYLMDQAQIASIEGIF